MTGAVYKPGHPLAPARFPLAGMVGNVIGSTLTLGEIHAEEVLGDLVVRCGLAGGDGVSRPRGDRERNVELGPVV